MTTATDIAKRLLEDEEDFDPKEYAMAQKYFLQPIEHGVNKEACAVTLNLSYASSIGLIVQLHSNDWVAQPMLNRQSIGLDQHTFKTKQEAANWVYKAYEEWSKLDLPEAEEEEIDHKDYIMSQLYAQPPHTGDIIGPGGKTVVRSRNLAGVRRYLRNHLVTRVNIWQFADSRHSELGALEILFDKGEWYRTRWESFSLLKWALRNWRNLYGVPLFIHGKPCGKIGFHNHHLKDDRT